MADETERVDDESLGLILQGVRRLVDDVLIPAEAETDANRQIAPEIIAQMREFGLFGLSVPAVYGGLGLTLSLIHI